MKLINTLPRVDYFTVLSQWEEECYRINLINKVNKDSAPTKEIEGWQCYEIFSWGVNEGKPSNSPNFVSCPITAKSIGLSLSDITEGEIVNNRGVKYLCKPYTLIIQEKVELIPLPPKPNAPTLWKEVQAINPLVDTYCKGGGYRDFYTSVTENEEKYKKISYCFDKVIKIETEMDDDIVIVTKYYVYHQYRFFPSRIEIWEDETSESIPYKDGVRYYYPSRESSESSWSNDYDGFLSPGYD